MGKKETWFTSVKKALSPDPKEKKVQVSKISSSRGCFIQIEIRLEFCNVSKYIYEFLQEIKNAPEFLIFGNCLCL